MKRLRLPLLVLLCQLLLAGCAGLLGPREVELPIAQLQQALDRHFPLSQRYLELFDVSISHPRLALEPGTNRIRTSFDALVAPPFFGQPWHGSLTISGVLQFDAQRLAIMLADPRVERFELDNVDSRTTTQIARIGGVLAEQLLRDFPLYTFNPDELRFAGTRFLPVRISTKSDALVVTLVPAK